MLYTGYLGIYVCERILVVESGIIASIALVRDSATLI